MSWQIILKNDSFESMVARLRKLDGERTKTEIRISESIPKELENMVMDMIRQEKYTKEDTVTYKDYIIAYNKHTDVFIDFAEPFSGFNGETLVISKRASVYSNMMGYPVKIIELGIFEQDGQPRLIDG
jgi:hypothetical protein